MITLNEVIYPLAPAGLSCLACIWIFYRYIITLKKTVGLTMILILAISDFAFDLGLILFKFFEKSFSNFDFYFYMIIPLYFSIFWASAMSFLVFMSLRDKDFESKKTLLVTFFIVLFLTIGWYL